MVANILVLAPITKGSGNLSTATRIMRNLESTFENVVLKNSLDYKTFDGELLEICVQNRIDLILILHAYYSGRLFYNQNRNCLAIPIVCIFGGTDLHSPKSFWYPAVLKTLRLSKYLICFSHEMKCLANALSNDIEEKLVIIPQGVDVITRDETIIPNNVFDYLFESGKKVVTWAGSIRKVKDPLFIGN
jgi:hypothetical protein